jgi:hypothetical protein
MRNVFIPSFIPFVRGKDKMEKPKATTGEPFDWLELIRKFRDNASHERNTLF